MDKVTKSVATIIVTILIFIATFVLGFLYYWFSGFVWALIWNYFIADIFGFGMASAIQLAGILFCLGIIRSSFTSKSFEKNATSVYSACKNIVGESQIGINASIVFSVIFWIVLFILAVHVFMWVWNVCFPLILGIATPVISFWNSFFILFLLHYFLGRSEK